MPICRPRQDQRDGWGLGKIYDSAAGFFAFRRKVHRSVLASDKGNEKIHESVTVRLQAAASNGLYKPASLANGVPKGSVAPLRALEQALRWAAPNPALTGRTLRAAPSFVDRLMHDLGGG
jgi:hypothetical protein